MAIRGGEIAGVGSHREVASAHQGKAESGDCAMDGRDYRMRHPVDRFYRRTPSLDETRELPWALRGRRAEPCGKRPDTSARHEMPSRPANDDAAHAVVAPKRNRMGDQR